MTATERQFWDSAEKCHDAFPQLLQRAERYLARIPEIRLLVQKRDWAGARLSRPKLSRRAQLVHGGRDAEVTRFYREFGVFVAEVFALLDEIRNVLPYGVAERLQAQIGPNQIEATCRTLQRAAERFDEFWQCRDSEPMPPGAAGAGRRKRGPRPQMADHRTVRKIVGPYGLSWQAEGTLEEIALKLDEKQVPVPKRWTTEQKPKSRTWTRGVENYRRLAVQAIEYRLKMASR
jgi:hypothetical protein